MIGIRGERGSGISVLAARHEDDDDDGCERFYISVYFTYPYRGYITNSQIANGLK